MLRPRVGRRAGRRLFHFASLTILTQNTSLRTSVLNLALPGDLSGAERDATEADPDAAARFFSQSAEMQGAFELMKADEDSGQGKDHWRKYLRLAFHRLTQPPGYTMQTCAPSPHRP